MVNIFNGLRKNIKAVGLALGLSMASQWAIAQTQQAVDQTIDLDAKPFSSRLDTSYFSKQSADIVLASNEAVNKNQSNDDSNAIPNLGGGASSDSMDVNFNQNGLSLQSDTHSIKLGHGNNQSSLEYKYVNDKGGVLFTYADGDSKKSFLLTAVLNTETSGWKATFGQLKQEIENGEVTKKLAAVEGKFNLEKYVEGLVAWVYAIKTQTGNAQLYQNIDIREINIGFDRGVEVTTTTRTFHGQDTTQAGMFAQYNINDNHQIITSYGKGANNTESIKAGYIYDNWEHYTKLWVQRSKNAFATEDTVSLETGKRWSNGITTGMYVTDRNSDGNNIFDETSYGINLEYKFGNTGKPISQKEKETAQFSIGHVNGTVNEMAGISILDGKTVETIEKQQNRTSFNSELTLGEIVCDTQGMYQDKEIQCSVAYSDADGVDSVEAFIDDIELDVTINEGTFDIIIPAGLDTGSYQVSIVAYGITPSGIVETRSEQRNLTISQNPALPPALEELNRVANIEKSYPEYFSEVQNIELLLNLGSLRYDAKHVDTKSLENVQELTAEIKKIIGLIDADIERLEKEKSEAEALQQAKNDKQVALAKVLPTLDPQAILPTLEQSKYLDSRTALNAATTTKTITALLSDYDSNFARFKAAIIAANNNVVASPVEHATIITTSWPTSHNYDAGPVTISAVLADADGIVAGSLSYTTSWGATGTWNSVTSPTASAISDALIPGNHTVTFSGVWKKVNGSNDTIVNETHTVTIIDNCIWNGEIPAWWICI